MRLDLLEFTITGPVTDKANAGSVKSDVADANAQQIITQCATDTFSVSGSGLTGSGPPVICGENGSEQGKIMQSKNPFVFTAFRREKQLTTDHCCSATQDRFASDNSIKQLVCKPFCVV